MDNLFGMIRKNRIFGNPPETEDPYKVNFNPEEPKDTNRSIVASPGNDTPMMDQYKQSLGEMPTRDQYKSGVKGKIGAALAGFSEGMRGGDAYGATKKALDEPYEEAEDEWNKRIARTGQLASLETSINATKAKNALDYAKLGETHENNASLREYRQGRLGEEHSNNQSLKDYRGAQTRNINSEIENRGSESYNSPITGTRNHVDKNGKIIWSTKVDLTPGEKDKNELSLYRGKEGIRVAGDKDLDNTRTNNDVRAHQEEKKFDVTDPTIVNAAKDMETFKNDLLQTNIKLRDTMRSVSPTQQNAALTGAIEKAIIKNPSFASFKDAQGNIVGKDDDPNYTAFQQEVSDQLADSIGKNIELKPNSNPLSAKPNLNKTPKVISDADATKELRARGKAITPESIAMAKQLLGGQ